MAEGASNGESEESDRRMEQHMDLALTHGGKFHADDVFSAALLKRMNPEIRILRAFEVPEKFNGIVFDIGFGKYDHHQKDAEVRENGVPYAAFGLLWREFGPSLFGAELSPEQARREAAIFDFRFVQPLDEDDNNGTGHPLAFLIETFNPVWDSNRSPEDCFEEAVSFASVILTRQLDHMMSFGRAKGMVEAALKEATDHIVILPRFAPWKWVLTQSDAEFVVYPSQRGGFCAQAVPTAPDSIQTKRPFPEQWAGKTDAELKQISGIQTLTFCHKSRFLISAGCLEDAVKACRIAGKGPGR